MEPAFPCHTSPVRVSSFKAKVQEPSYKCGALLGTSGLSDSWPVLLLADADPSLHPKQADYLLNSRGDHIFVSLMLGDFLKL